jgi:hypothetical protein
MSDLSAIAVSDDGELIGTDGVSLYTMLDPLGDPQVTVPPLEPEERIDRVGPWSEGIWVTTTWTRLLMERDGVWFEAASGVVAVAAVGHAKVAVVTLEDRLIELDAGSSVVGSTEVVTELGVGRVGGLVALADGIVVAGSVESVVVSRGAVNRVDSGTAWDRRATSVSPLDGNGLLVGSMTSATLVDPVTETVRLLAGGGEYYAREQGWVVGLHELLLQRASGEPRHFPSPADRLTSAVVSSDGTLILGDLSFKGIRMVSADGVTGAFPLPSSARFLAVDSSGVILAGTLDAVYEIDGLDVSMVAVNPGATAASDHPGGGWVLAGPEGVWRLQSQTLSAIADGPGGLVFGVAVTPASAVFVGSDSGLWCISEDGEPPVIIDTAGAAAWSVQADQFGRIFVGTPNGFGIIDSRATQSPCPYPAGPAVFAPIG